MCTGALLDSTHALTAAQCVYDPDQPTRVLTGITFIPGAVFPSNASEEPTGVYTGCCKASVCAPRQERDLHIPTKIRRVYAYI